MLIILGFIAVLAMLATAEPVAAAKQQSTAGSGSYPGGSYDACVNARKKNPDAPKWCRRCC